MYEPVENVLELNQGKNGLIIMGDFNVIISEEYDDNVSGKFGLRSRNEKGERLLNFCNQYNLTPQNKL